MTDVRTLLADAVRTGWRARENKDAKRIRELEAELAVMKEAVADKATRNSEGPVDYWAERCAKAEARVAELEAHCCVKTRGGEYWAREKEE